MKITFVGGGNMAGALIGGLIGKGHAPEAIRVVEIQSEARARLAAQHGVACAEGMAALGPLGDVVVLAVKPQHMRAAAQALRPLLQKQLVITIAHETTPQSAHPTTQTSTNYQQRDDCQAGSVSQLAGSRNQQAHNHKQQTTADTPSNSSMLDGVAISAA